MEGVEFDIGTYTGHIVDNRPHGKGKLTYKSDDPMGRTCYDGEWSEGKSSGKGKMTFANGDIYDGDFSDNVPHGKGDFKYTNGDIEQVSLKVLFINVKHYETSSFL